MGIKKLENETREQYIHKIYGKKEELGYTNKECAELINSEFGTNFQESYLRGIHKNYSLGYEDGLEKGLSSAKNNFSEENEILREIKIERNKLQVEKQEINKLVRDYSRVDLRFEQVIKAIKNLEPFTLPEVSSVEHCGDTEGILTLSDQHFGKNCLIRGLNNEIINEYNEEVFKERMWKVFSEVVDIIYKEKINTLHIAMLGDSIEGMLRISTLAQLKHGMIDQCMQFAEFMANWFNELSEYCKLDIHYTLGNHSETRILNSKSGDFPEENLERIVVFYLKARLADNHNIIINDSKAGFIYFNCLGTNVMASHGQNEKNLEQAVKDYSFIYKEDINLFISGHLHHSFSKSIGMNCEVIKAPSLCSVDEYSMKLRRTSGAGALLFVIEEGKGKTITYDIKLK